MRRSYLLGLTGLIEVGTGVLLLILPSVPLALLLGLNEAAPETLFIGRVFGAALLAIGIASWLARGDTDSPAQYGQITGVLTYDVGAASLLAYAGTAMHMAGIVLWPAVVLHASLAVWCLLCFLQRPRAK